MSDAYEQIGQDWWNTAQEMEYYQNEQIHNEGYNAGDLFNIGYNFWENTLNPYISEEESTAGISPLGMITGWGNIIAPTGTIEGIGEIGGINPQSHWQIGQEYDIQSNILGSKFGLEHQLEQSKLGYSGLIGSSNNNLYENYISEISQLQDTSAEQYGDLFSDYGQSIDLGIEAADMSGAYGTGDYQAEGGIDLSDTIYEEDMQYDQSFQICVESHMVNNNNLTPEGFAQASSYCYNTMGGFSTDV